MTGAVKEPRLCVRQSLHPGGSLALVEGAKHERVNKSILCFKVWISAINSIRQEDEVQSGAGG